MATQIPERPGSFRDFVAAATDPLDGADISVTEFKYRYSAGQVRRGARLACSQASGCGLRWYVPVPRSPPWPLLGLLRCSRCFAAAPALTVCIKPTNPFAPHALFPPQVANILWSAGVPDKARAAALVARLNGAGMPTDDISDIDSAQVGPGRLRARGVGGCGVGCMVCRPAAQRHTRALRQSVP